MHITLICADDDRWASGMRSLSGALRAAGHATTKVLAGGGSAAPNDAEAAALASLARDSRIIGVSSMSRGSKRAKAILGALRPLGKVMVWGGMHPSLFPGDCTPHADLVCRGEGEGFIIDLAARVESGASFLDIQNGAYGVTGQAIFNDVRPLIKDLDALPLPDYSAENEFDLNGGRLRQHDGFREAKYVLLSGSRGCLYNCAYCSNGSLRTLYRGPSDQGRYARKMSVRRFVEVAEECRRIFPRMTSFYFTDEDFFARPKAECEEFAELYAERVGLPFECMASPLQIDGEKMALMVRAGMWRIDVGVESGSERTRTTIMGRRITDTALMRAALAVSSYPEVVAYYFLIIGNPYEQRRDLVESVKLLRDMPGQFFLRTYNLVFLPGTPLFERACRDGIIAGLEDSGHDVDFLAGFDYRGPDWKGRNLYLNSLLALMTGKHTSQRMGLVPRALTPSLTAPMVIDFCDRHSQIGKALVLLSRGALAVRRRGLESISRIFRDHRFAYSLGFLKARAGTPPAVP